MEHLLDQRLQATLVLIQSLALIRRGEPKVEDVPFHLPVLLEETVHHLAVRPGGVYLDCTVGDGGHASAILKVAAPEGWLLGIDLDPRALDRARLRLREYEGSCTLIEGNYARAADLTRGLGYRELDGVLLDLGLSSFQLESRGRGFSLRRDDPLDMRYDPNSDFNATRIVNEYPPEELVRVIASQGQEPRARAIARAITQLRPLETTVQLADLVARTYGGRRGRIHPATRTFQALRIEVNSELDNLQAGLGQAIQLLKPGGRLVVISYHSLEDRIVKSTLARESRGCICPPGVPVCICGHTPTLKIISRKVVKPSREEVLANPRSRSARMRVAEGLR